MAGLPELAVCSRTISVVKMKLTMDTKNLRVIMNDPNREIPIGFVISDRSALSSCKEIFIYILSDNYKADNWQIN